MSEHGAKLNRYGTPEMVMHWKDGSRLLSVTEAEGYADAVIQRLGLVGKGLGPNPHEQAKDIPFTIFCVLMDAGEIVVPRPDGKQITEDIREYALILIVTKAVGAILGFNKSANEHLGEGQWKL